MTAELDKIKSKGVIVDIIVESPSLKSDGLETTTMITNLLREGGCRAQGEENFICVESGHNLSVSHGSHGGMENKRQRRVRNLGYSTVYVSTVIRYFTKVEFPNFSPSFD